MTSDLPVEIQAETQSQQEDPTPLPLRGPRRSSLCKQRALGERSAPRAPRAAPEAARKELQLTADPPSDRRMGIDEDARSKGFAQVSAP